MLNLDTTIINQVVKSAKEAAAGQPRWTKAIERAAAELLDNPYIERDGDHLLLVSSTSGKVYSANGICQCQAFQHGKPCWHRAAGRLIQRYDEAMARRAAYDKACRDMDEII